MQCWYTFLKLLVAYLLIFLLYVYYSLIYICILKEP